VKRLLPALLLFVMAAPVDAQWLGLTTPGIPRTADGKPDLGAPVPRAADGRPDLSGVWRRASIRGDLNDSAGVQPWIRELMEERAHNLFKDNPGYQCLPRGPGHHTAEGTNYKQIVQHATAVAILNDDLTYRRIFLDGRALETAPQPTWMGYSVGRWDGDTLVVESNGFNDKTWLAGNGLSHTEQVRLTERYRRADFGHLSVEVTYTDPAAFDEPKHAVFELEFAADDAMLEIVCDESPEGQRHWIGTMTSAHASAAAVPLEILSKYVGTYRGLYGQNIKTVEMILEGNALYVRQVGRPKTLLVPRSEEVFETPAVGYIFTRGGDGIATQVAEVHVSGAWVFERLTQQQ
jgi:hypothetical protein